MTTIQSLRTAAAQQIASLSASCDRGWGPPDLLFALESCDLAAAQRVAVASDAQLVPIVEDLCDFRRQVSGLYSESDDSSLSDLFAAARSLAH
jgi:hypothetical protein